MKRVLFDVTAAVLDVPFTTARGRDIIRRLKAGAD
jgi:hypothetical protein